MQVESSVLSSSGSTTGHRISSLNYYACPVCHVTLHQISQWLWIEMSSLALQVKGRLECPTAVQVHNSPE